MWSHIVCYDLEPLVIFNGRLNSMNYVAMLENGLTTAFKKCSPEIIIENFISTGQCASIHVCIYYDSRIL